MQRVSILFILSTDNISVTSRQIDELVMQKKYETFDINYDLNSDLRSIPIMIDDMRQRFQRDKSVSRQMLILFYDEDKHMSYFARDKIHTCLADGVGVRIYLPANHPDMSKFQGSNAQIYNFKSEDVLSSFKTFLEELERADAQNKPADEDKQEPDTPKPQPEPVATKPKRKPPVDPTPVKEPPARKPVQKHPKRKPQYKTESLDKYLKPVEFDWKPQPTKQDMLNPEWWYPEHYKNVVEGVNHSEQNSWILAGASRRGLSHQNVGTPRDDAFRLGQRGAWNIMALSDGAGSAKYSRITANRSCELAIELLQDHAVNVPPDSKNAVDYIRTSIESTLQRVYRLQQQITRQNSFEKNQTYCTFLLIVHQPLDNGACLFGYAHVGDGMIYVASPAEGRVISTGKKGTQANETEFVLSLSEAEVVSRAQSFATGSDANLDFFMLLSDGVSDDLLPSSQDYKRGMRVETIADQFAGALRKDYLTYPCYEEWGTILDWYINYDRNASFDDRSISIITRQPITEVDCP